MKKILIMVVVMFVASATTFGQGVDIGLKGGVNLAKMSFDESAVTDESNRTGFHFGAYATVKLPAGIGVQIEAYYSVQGSDISFGAAKSEIETKYLQVPILFRYSPVPVFNIHIGPQFGILMNAESITGTDVDDIKDELKSSDLSLAAGVGLNLPMGLNFTLRYVKGLSDLNDDLGLTGSAKSSMFQISAGYRLFNLGR